jgi:hypothetical protein
MADVPLHVRSSASADSIGAIVGAQFMSRLYDRIRAQGTRQLRAADLILDRPNLRDSFVAARFEGSLVRPELADEALRRAMVGMAAIRSKEALRPGELHQMPVVVADNVGQYFAQYPDGTNVSKETRQAILRWHRLPRLPVKLVELRGVEPLTPRLPASCSPN